VLPLNFSKKYITAPKKDGLQSGRKPAAQPRSSKSRFFLLSSPPWASAVEKSGRPSGLPLYVEIRAIV